MCACSVVSKSLWPLGLQPTRSLWAGDSPGKNTGVGCHSLLQGVKLASLTSLALGGGFFTTSATWEGDCLLKDKSFMLDMVDVSLLQKVQQNMLSTYFVRPRIRNQRCVRWDRPRPLFMQPGWLLSSRKKCLWRAQSVLAARWRSRQLPAASPVFMKGPWCWPFPRPPPGSFWGFSGNSSVSGSAAFSVCYTLTFPLKLWGRHWKRFRGLQLRRCMLFILLFLPKWYPPLPKESRLPELHSWARRSGEARWQGFLEVSCFV